MDRNKKIFLLLYGITAAVACTSDFYEESGVGSQIEADITFHATIAGNGETKTYIDEFGVLTRWHAEDPVSVLIGSENRKYCFDGATGDIEGDFIPYIGFNGSTEPVSSQLAMATKSSYNTAYLVYPYSDSNAYDASTAAISMTLPPVQEYCETGFAQNVNPMIAVADVSAIQPGTKAIVNVSFRNAASLLGVKLFGTDVVKSVLFSGNAGEKIAGDAQVVVDENGIPQLTMKGSATDAVKLDCGAGIALQPLSNQTSIFWLVIPPVEFATGFTIKVVNCQGDTLVKSITDPVAFARSKKTVMAPFEMSETTTPRFSSITFSNGGKTFTPFMVSDSAVHVMVEHDDDLSSMTASFTYTGRDITVNGVNQQSGVSVNDYSDFANPVVYSLKSSTGVKKDVKVNLYDLPVLVINTPGGVPITSKDIRLDGCTMVLYGNDGNVTDLGTAGIKGRGNTTWVRPKKPYNVKLDSKQRILGINDGKKSKKWTLLANNYYDKTHLHNDVAYAMARLTDYPWVQSGEFVEVIFNGVHQGNYYLTQKPAVEKNKIEIDENNGILLESTMTALSGTVFGTDYFNTSGGYNLHWFIDSPEEWAVTKRDSVRTMLNHMESLIADPVSLVAGEYRTYFDIETAIDWYLIEELAQNDEAQRSKNMTLYLDKDSTRFVMGPPWDLDFSTFHSPNWKVLKIKNAAFCFDALCGDPYYVGRLKAKWNQYKVMWAAMAAENGYIDQRYEQIHRSAERDIVMWPEWLYPDDKCTYLESVQRMKVAINGRIPIMDNLINAL